MMCGLMFWETRLAFTWEDWVDEGGCMMMKMIPRQNCRKMDLGEGLVSDRRYWRWSCQGT